MDTKSFKQLQNNLLTGVAKTHIYDLIKETPLTHAALLSAQTGNNILLKREDTQPVFSFKIRGAYHKMTQIGIENLNNGVVAASAGNHAQGVAMAAQQLGCQATVFMPKHTHDIKVKAVRRRNANVVLQGDSFEEAQIAAKQFAEEHQAVWIAAFDDVDIITGNATIAAEVLRQRPGAIDAIFCAVGGGGLIAGVAGYIKLLQPDIKVIGVEPEEAAAMQASLQAGKKITLDTIGYFAESVALKAPGELTFEFARHLVDEMITVSNDEICAAVKDLYEDTRVIFEPSGALAIAGLKRYVADQGWQGKDLIALACGANMSFDRLEFIAERADIGEHKEALFAVTVPERPGSFGDFCRLIGQRRVTEFNYRMDDPHKAHIFVGVQTQDQSERQVLLSKLRDAGLPAFDMTDDEMAKLHIRHLVGGRAQVAHEVLYRFEFPEYPGALTKFLDMLSQSGLDWNISLFHYRNHGADLGRVLAGIQVPPEEREQFKAFLKNLGYPYQPETENPAYRTFLQTDTTGGRSL